MKSGQDLEAVGLTQQEAERRLAEFGPNELQKEKGVSPLKLFVEQFEDILMIILLIATLLSVYLGEITDAIVIFAIVLACATLGFIQEYRSERALEALKKMTAPTALVLRDGKETVIQAREVVPGDVIILRTGDRVPADSRLIEGFNLKADEAPLTGESSPVDKNRGDTVFSGTVIVYGRGKAVATSTGMNTQFGKIAKMVQFVQEEETPLEKRMASVGKWIGILSFSVCLIVASIGIIEGRNIPEMLLWGVSLAVAAVPEALPAIVTGALAVGMYRMVRVNSIVRRLPAVETLGCTSVICSDKTGTMTKGEMTVTTIYLNHRTVKVTGVGYEPKGEFLLEGEKVDPSDVELRRILKVAVMCNDARLESEDKTGRWLVRGDPTEGALIVVAAKAGLRKEELEMREPRIGEVPFTSERKRMTTIHLASGEKRIAFMKGAPEVVLQRCSFIQANGKSRRITDRDRERVLKVNEVMAADALRNLGFAFRELPHSSETFDEGIEKDMVFLGIMGMIDPPREEVKDAIELCRRAGIRVIMVTGDHRLTAIAVAKELNLLDQNSVEGKVLTGEELDRTTDDKLLEIVQNIAIYARTSPEHKTRIIKALKAKGHIVAMTGDGVNDAPALKMAHIGISMGITGTEVAKEASDMVLTDDNFASIVKAVKEGREIYDNIKKYLTYLLRCNIMEIMVMFSAMITVPYLSGGHTESSATVALTAAQILWVNLTTDGLPAMALGIDPGDPDLMDRKPRDPTESVFTRDVKVYLTATPILMTVLLISGYIMCQPWRGEHELFEARTQLLTSMILMELANAISARSLRYTVFKVGIFKNKYLWLAVLSSLALQLAVLYTPALQVMFEVHAPELVDWMFAILSATLTFGALEAGKYLNSRARSLKSS
jgi:Ca2+-transporting ATPase